MQTLKNVFPHLLVGVLFIGLSLAYFYPLLSQKVIQQSDITQFKGMQRQIVEHRAEFDEEPYWIDNAFLGMPTYQITSNYPADILGWLDHIIRFLPRPADYLFVYLFGFYLFMISLKTPIFPSLIGALAFGFSTYMIIILGVGHNTKALAIGYIPLVLAGVFMVLKKRRRLGFILSTLALGLQIHANHYQMTYYMFVLILVIGIVYARDAYVTKTMKSFLHSIGILFGALILALSLNATGLLATKEYTSFSTRGPSSLSITPNDTPIPIEKGLPYDYITEYSYGIIESLNLFIPRFMGGANSDVFDEKSSLFSLLRTIDPETAQQIYRYATPYWGDQPIVAAPAYVGAVVMFLALIGFILMQPKQRHWLLAGTLVSLVLSWGKNVETITVFLIDYFPLYNKFRAVSSIQIILELCLPIAAVYGIVTLLNNSISKQKKQKTLIYALGSLLGVIGLTVLSAHGLLSFTSSNEIFISYPEIMTPIIEDRKSILLQDCLRTFLFVSVTFLLCNVLLSTSKNYMVLGGLAFLTLIDLWSFDRNYVNSDQFVSKIQLHRPFSITQADRAILQDTTRYRVFEPSLGVSHARTAFFHQAIGGYHGAKMSRFQDLYDFYIAKNNRQIINMLNVKYIIQPPTDDNALGVVKNPNAFGDVWLIEQLKQVENANIEIKNLEKIDLKKIALTTQKRSKTYEIDTTAQISLSSNKANELIYSFKSTTPQYAVFSEMYYPDGWKAYINNQLVEHDRVNYTLRGLEIPSGDHRIRFAFEPHIIQTGTRIQIGGGIIFFVVVLMILYVHFFKKSTTVE